MMGDQPATRAHANTDRGSHAARARDFFSGVGIATPQAPIPAPAVRARDDIDLGQCLAAPLTRSRLAHSTRQR
jgi:hypothetical protein